MPDDSPKPQHTPLSNDSLKMLRCVRSDDHSSQVCPGCVTLTIDDRDRKLAIAEKALQELASRCGPDPSRPCTCELAQDALADIEKLTTPKS
jgi:hypothetical protein